VVRDVKNRLCGQGRIGGEYAENGRGMIVMTTLKQFNDALGFVSPQNGNRRTRPVLNTIKTPVILRRSPALDYYSDLAPNCTLVTPHP
jgi:hypothetical protein